MSLVLLVDDEFDILTTYEVLFQLEGFETAVARNGKDALLRVAEQQPDLVLTDFMMPVMNGIELCRRLRADPGTRDIPIILSSAVAPELGRPGSLCDAFFMKPVMFDDVIARVRGLLVPGDPAA
jgi:CheY-like chemotaxis protein